jgi:hypothetical protein
MMLKVDLIPCVYKIHLRFKYYIVSMFIAYEQKVNKNNAKGSKFKILIQTSYAICKLITLHI